MKKTYMTNEDYELFELTVKATQSKLHKMMHKILKRNYKNIINTSDYIMAQGDIPIAIVAHMDTVFKLPPGEVYFDKQKGVLWSPDGLGADDRAGVFLILKIIQLVKKDKKPTIILTTDEEIGCIGSYQLSQDFKEPPWDLKYIIQLDRRGQDDCVFYDDINEKFAEYVETFGFKTAWGSLSDISVICPTWGVSGVNLSVGYEDEHREIETLHIKYTYMTLAKVLTMLDDVDNAEHYKYEGAPTSWWNYAYKSPYSWDDDEDWGYTYNYNGSAHCPACGKPIVKNIAVKAKDCYGNKHYYCGECAADIVDWCAECGCAFIPQTKHQTLCSDCIDKSWEKKDNGNFKHKGN